MTKKDLVLSRSFDWQTVFPHIVIFSWILFSCFIAIYRLIHEEGYEMGYIITLLWSIYNLYGLFYAILLGKNRKIESDSEALSIVTNRQLVYSSQAFEMYQMSFNGFRIRAGKEDLFTPGERYLFVDPKHGMSINSICRENKGSYLTFSFEDLNPESAEKLASYYSDQLNAAKQLEFDMEDILDGSVNK